MRFKRQKLFWLRIPLRVGSISLQVWAGLSEPPSAGPEGALWYSCHSKDRSGCQLIMGLTGLNLGEITPQSVKPEEEGRRENIDLQCLCRSGGSGLSSLPAVQASPAPRVSLHTTLSQPPSQLTPLSAAVEKAVTGVVKGSIEVEVRLIWGSATALHAQQVELLVDYQVQCAVLRPISSGRGWKSVLGFKSSSGKGCLCCQEVSWLGFENCAGYWSRV